MLNIQLIERKDRRNMEVVTDIEKIFRQVEFKRNATVDKVMMEIDKARYLDEYTIIDRFGIAWDKRILSTGCKAAIILANGYTGLINTIECGYNAIESIIRNCRSGNIIVDTLYTVDPYYYEDENGMDMCDCEDTEKIEIDVCVDGYRFTNLWRLNHYLNDEYRMSIDLGLPGVEKIK